MKIKYQLIVALHVLAIVICSAMAALCTISELWFTMAIIILADILFAMNLYRVQRQQWEAMHSVILALKNRETSLHISSKYSDTTLEMLNKELQECIKNINEQHRSDAILQSYYAQLLDKADIAVLVCNNEWQIEWCNQAATKLLGSRATLQQEIIEQINSPIITINRHGQIRRLNVSKTQFNSGNSAITMISLKEIGSLLDMNEFESWQKLTRVLTHEIMNSLTPIISISDTLLTGEVDADMTKQAISTINRRGQGLLNFVENYRKLTKIPTPVLGEVSAAELISDINHLFNLPYIEYDVHPEEHKLLIDRTLIEQVLINLIKNAIEACSETENPKIKVKIHKIPNSHTRISISDNGPGILPEVKDRIFVPFFTTKESGSGIGLSLCKQIILLHNGQIGVTSSTDEETHGTKFTITL